MSHTRDEVLRLSDRIFSGLMYLKERSDAADMLRAYAEILGHPFAYCNPTDPFNETAFAWPGTLRDETSHTMPLYASPTQGEK